MVVGFTTTCAINEHKIMRAIGV